MDPRSWLNMVRCQMWGSGIFIAGQFKMNQTTTHNPDRYMADLRQILAQGRKRIGFLLGAGVPASVKVNSEGQHSAEGGPLLPDVEGLTQKVLDKLTEGDKKVVNLLSSELGMDPTIELILTRIRRLAEAIGDAEIRGLDSKGYEELAERICGKIGEIVGCSLPEGRNSYTRLISWISGTPREYPVEIFTPNYDLLFEEAFERSQVSYYDGFTGAHRPFFDSASITDDELSPRWSRLWKIHGSLGWKSEDGKIIRTGSHEDTHLIYPDHHKYDQISRQPYSAFFERLRTFLMTPDSLLICAGFSFSDSHITAVLDEALAINPHTAIIAFEFCSLTEDTPSAQLAFRRSSVNVYARKNAIICGTLGLWELGRADEAWEPIRKTFWRNSQSEDDQGFLLNDFAWLANFLALAQADDLKPDSNMPVPNSNASDGESPFVPNPETSDGQDDA